MRFNKFIIICYIFAKHSVLGYNIKFSIKSLHNFVTVFCFVTIIKKMKELIKSCLAGEEERRVLEKNK